MDRMDGKLIEVDGRQASLGEAMAQVDEALRAGKEIDPGALRELCARWNSDGQLAKRLHKLFEHWPYWAKGYAMQGIHMSVARQHGHNKTYIELFIESNQSPPPNLALLPMQAWTVLNGWLSEGGPKAGVDLPAWVWDYLGEAARKMQSLRAKADLPASVRRKQIPAALGYQAGKGDIFKADWNGMETEVAAMIYDDEGRKGRKGEARIAAVRDFFRLQDTRTARRYVQEGKQGRSPPPPWLK